MPANGVPLPGGSFSLDLAPRLRVLVDPRHALSPDEALRRMRAGEGRPVARKYVDFGFDPSRFWLYVPLVNAATTPMRYKLRLGLTRLDELRVYVVGTGSPASGSLQPAFMIGRNDPFNRRGEAFRHFAPTLTLAAGEHAELLLSYASDQATQLPVYLETPDVFRGKVAAADLHNLILFGLLAGMTLVSTIYLLALGSRTAIYYGLYIAVSGLFLFHADGYAFQYLWPDWPDGDAAAVAPIAFAMVAAGSAFARSFVDAPNRHPRLDRLLQTTIWISLLMVLVSPLLLPYQLFKTLGIAFVGLSVVNYLAAGILALRQSQPGAGFYLAGAMAVAGSIVFAIVTAALPGRISLVTSGNGGRYALIFEGLAFALAILYRIQSIRRERDAAMRREIELGREQLAALEALRQAEKGHQRAVALAEMRRTQLATTAHDIQQPIAALRLALNRIEAAGGTQSAQLQASFDYLGELIRRNLAETRPEAGEPEAPRTVMPAGHDGGAAAETFPASIVLDNVLAMFAQEAERKGLDLRLVRSSASLHAEPMALMRILSNLVSNAVKYTDTGRILIGCRRKRTALSIQVHDTGSGLSPEEIATVLKPYGRKAQRDGRGPAGTGLGLSVVQDLARAKGFGFDVASLPGRGSVFRIEVPHGETAIEATGG